MSEEIHAGVISIADEAWVEIFRDVLNVASTDIQGILRDKGVFATIHDCLLLPETYTVHGIFYKWMYRQWNVVVEGPDLPLVIEGMEYPQVTPIYQSNQDGSTQLLRIES